MQRQIGRGYQSGLFLEAEQKALDTFLPGGKVSELAQPVQRGLGKDVMQRLQERHGENILSNREMQAYAFGAYTTLKSKKKNLAAPNPVIRAFNRLFELVKRAGNVFRKNKINNVNQLFEKARTGEIGKRAKPKEGVEQLRKEALAREDKKELSLTTVKTDKGDIKSIIPNIDPNYGEEIIKTIYNRGITGNRLLKMQVARRRPEQKGEAEDVVLLANNEQQLLSDKEYIIVRDDVTGATARIGDASGRNVSKEYGTPELTRIGKAYARAVERAPGLELSLSAIQILEKPPTIKATGAVVKKTGKKKILIDDVFNYLEKNTRSKNKNKPLNIEDEKVFKNLVAEGVKEYKYQIEKPITGKGWYDKDVKKAMSLVEEFIPETKQSPILKELIPFLTAIFSAGTPVGTDWKNAINVTRLFAENKRIPIKNPNEFYTAKDEVVKKGLAKIGDEKNFGRFPSHRQALEFSDFYIQKNGLKNFLKWLDTETTVKEINEGVRKESGVYKGGMEGAMGKKVTGADMFGDKVGAFMKNLQGISDENVIDIWNARGFNRKAGTVWARNADGSIRKDKKGKLIAAGEPRNNKEAAIMNSFMSEVAKEVGESVRDTQAVLWYFEQGLYTSLGVKSE